MKTTNLYAIFGVDRFDSLDDSKSFGTYDLEKLSSNTLKYKHHERFRWNHRHITREITMTVSNVRNYMNWNVTGDSRKT